MGNFGRVFFWLSLAMVLVLGPACGSSASSPKSWFELPTTSTLSDEHFLDLPFPFETRRNEKGHPIFTGLLNKPKRATVKTYAAEAERLLTDFPTSTALYLRFRDSIDVGLLPDAAGSVAPSSPVSLINVTASSPGYLSRAPIQFHFRKKDGQYWLSNTLAVLPALGHPLEPNTTYALVATRALRDETGEPFSADRDLANLLNGNPTSPVLAEIIKRSESVIRSVETAGISRRDIVHFSFFKTGAPTEELFRIRDYVRTSFPAPKWTGLTQKETTDSYDAYEGSFGPSPNFQAGTSPYITIADGGEFQFAPDGTPIVQNTFDARFVVTVPKCAMPQSGFPILLYAHGTGGDYRSLVRESSGAARLASKKCIAAIGVDQIFHGTRPGAPAPSDPYADSKIQTAFFNLTNPAAARSGPRQSGIDVVQEARLFSESRVTIPAAISRNGQEIRFDGSKILFFGHSQGGINGPLFLASDDQALGGVLSGTGAMFSIALLEKTSPSPSVAGAVKLILGLLDDEDADELNLYHPVINIAQALVETADPLVYFPSLIRSPRGNFRPKSVFLTEGINPDGTGDTYTPPHSIETAFEALEIARVTPLIRSFPTLRSVPEQPSDRAFSGNLAGGRATGFLMQFLPVRDGHFVAFDVPRAQAVSAEFLDAMAKTGIGAYVP